MIKSGRIKEKEDEQIRKEVGRIRKEKDMIEKRRQACRER